MPYVIHTIILGMICCFIFAFDIVYICVVIVCRTCVETGLAYLIILQLLYQITKCRRQIICMFLPLYTLQQELRIFFNQ